MIAINDLKNSIKLMKYQYDITDKVLSHIKEKENTEVEIDNASHSDIADALALLQEQKLLRFDWEEQGDGVPPCDIPRLTYEGHRALELGIKAYFNRKRISKVLLSILYILLVISILATPIIAWYK